MKNAPYVTSAESDTIKISIATTPEEKREIYRMNKFREFYNEIENPYFAEISKGMILPQYRNSPAMLLL